MRTAMLESLALQTQVAGVLISTDAAPEVVVNRTFRVRQVRTVNLKRELFRWGCIGGEGVV